MKIGILTGGGDCPGLNAAIRAVSKSLIHDYKAELIAIEDGFLGLIERRCHQLDWRTVSGILNSGGTLLGTSNRASPYSYNGKDVSGQVVEYYNELGLDCIVAMGGDGTMSLSYELSKLGINFVGVPKTIDNDLAGTDRTFGFDTAVSIATEAIDRLQTTAESHKRVMIVETMGRYAGWIALHAGMAGGADIILIPEYPYHLEEIQKVILEREKKQGFTIIVIAEGARPQQGNISVNREMDPNSPDPIRLGGAGAFLENSLASKVNTEIRTTVIGHVQRGGHPSALDRIVATNVGSYAASLVGRGQYGRMVIVHNNHMSSIPLATVAHSARGVPRNDMTLISALSIGVSLGDPNLKIPLLGIHDEQMLMG